MSCRQSRRQKARTGGPGEMPTSAIWAVGALLWEACLCAGWLPRTVRGTVAAYVWDYSGGMWMLRHFWEAAFELVPEARQLREVRRFAECAPEALSELFAAAGLENVSIQALDGTATFRDFDDYWAPFLAGQGAAPAFAASLPTQTQSDLALSLRHRLPIAPDGSITLGLRAWAIRGVVEKDWTPGPKPNPAGD